MWLVRIAAPVGSVMFSKPKPALTPNTYAYESEPMVKPTGFREYDARWLLGTEINLMGVQALGIGLGTLIHQLDGATAITRITSGQYEIERPDATITYLLWNNGGVSRLPSTLHGSLLVTSPTGEIRRVDTAQLNLTGEPIFVVPAT